jgi:hypothetical protein
MEDWGLEGRSFALLDGCGHDALFITGAAVVPFCLNLLPFVWRVKPCWRVKSCWMW